MKKFLMIIGFLFVSLFTFSQTDDGRSMKPIVQDVYSFIQTVENNGNEIVKLEFDIVTTDTKNSYRVLTNSWTYRIVVMGDYRSEDMDLEVYKQLDDGTYEFVTKDSKTESFAVIDITPSKTAWYKFVVKCYKFKPGYTSCHYGLIVFHN